MATKVVTYISTTCLPCGCQGTVNVIMCTIYGQTVPGMIIESSGTSGCTTGNWQYQISYESEDLPEGVTALATTDITGVACKGCLATWFEEQLEANVINYTPQGVAVRDDNDGVAFNYIASSPDDEIGRLSITIVNPSATRILRGMISWSWVLEVSSEAAFSSGADSSLEIDGIDQGTTGSAYYQDASGGIIFVRFIGGAGFQELDVPAGATVVVELVFVSQNQVAPSATALAATPMLAFSGSTTTT